MKLEHDQQTLSLPKYFGTVLPVPQMQSTFVQCEDLLPQHSNGALLIHAYANHTHPAIIH